MEKKCNYTELLQLLQNRKHTAIAFNQTLSSLNFKLENFSFVIESKWSKKFHAMIFQSDYILNMLDWNFDGSRIDASLT